MYKLIFCVFLVVVTSQNSFCEEVDKEEVNPQVKNSVEDNADELFNISFDQDGDDNVLNNKNSWVEVLDPDQDDFNKNQLYYDDIIYNDYTLGSVDYPNDRWGESLDLEHPQSYSQVDLEIYPLDKTTNDMDNSESFKDKFLQVWSQLGRQNDENTDLTQNLFQETGLANDKPKMVAISKTTIFFFPEGAHARDPVSFSRPGIDLLTKRYTGGKLGFWPVTFMMGIFLMGMAVFFSCLVCGHRRKNRKYGNQRGKKMQDDEEPILEKV